MEIDDFKKNRDLILKLVNKPLNQDVIYYDNKFIDLININVDKLYQDEFKEYNNLLNKYNDIKQKINDYNDRINTVKLVNNKMTEEEYINKIQKLEIEYAKKYKEIKIVESKINTYKNKIKDYNNKIEIQKAKEIESNRNKQNKILVDKKKLSTNINNLKILFDNKKKTLEIIKDKLDFEREKYNLFEQTKSNIKSSKCVCEYCKSTLDEKASKIAFENAERQQSKILKKIQKLKDDYEKKDIEKEDVLIKLNSQKMELNNIKNIEKQNLFNYEKKSIEVLRLEGAKFELENEVEKLQKEYTDLVKKAGPSFRNLKSKLNSYKESLLNLHDIKENKEQLSIDLEIYNDIIEQAKEIKKNLVFHFEFLMVRNKLWEQKISNLFDNKLKFKLFKEEGLQINEIFVIYYNNIEQKFLTPTEEKIVENMILEKIKLLEDI